MKIIRVEEEKKLKADKNNSLNRARSFKLGL
jgi:hypothetical protein